MGIMGFSVLFVDQGSISNFGFQYGVPIMFIMLILGDELLGKVGCGFRQIGLVSECMTGRMSAILAQASEARLGENSRNAKPGLCSSISLGREQLA